MPVPQIQVPNTAAQFIALQQNEAKNAAASNAAIVEILKLKQKQAEAQKKDKIEAYEYALNLLSSVNSDDDMTIAKKILKAKYPETAGGIDQMMPGYDPRSVKLLRNSLRNETQKLKLEAEQTELKGFGPGTQVYRGGKKEEQVPFAPTKPDFEVFSGPDGNQVYVRKGDAVPEGFTKVQGKGTEVTVNTGNMTTATKSKLQQDIIEGKQNIESFKKTRDLFKTEYLTMFGKGERMLASVADKAGVSTEGQKKLIRDRSKWFRQAKADFIAFRKWATGVAGGEKELAEIATAFPDPVKNSPEEYKANLDNIEETTRRVLELNRDFLNSGMEEAAESPAVTIIKYDEKGNRIQ